MHKKAYKIAFLTVLCGILMILSGIAAGAKGYNPSQYGGGYAASGQIDGVSYTTEVYDASNGLPTSDAMFVIGASDGHMWIGGYSGVIRYDGTVFERLDTAGGLTSARGIFEDKTGRIWVGTNDNGVVVIDGNERIHLTYKDGLPSSSIRIFAEDADGNVFVGTTAGVCYVDPEMRVHALSDPLLDEARVLKLDADAAGRIYGQASGGLIFAIDHCRITEIYNSIELMPGKASTILVDPETPGNVYIGTDGSTIFHGRFGSKADQMEQISVAPLEGIHWLNYDCGRIWVSSTSKAGYLDERNRFHELADIPFYSGIEMITSDYQGNLWVASSTQGVMKLVTNNFADATKNAGLPGVVTNAVHLHDGNMYVGTDEGLRVIGTDGKPIENDLTAYLGDSRIRCIKADTAGNLWIATYTNNLGLVCLTSDGMIKNYTTKEGLRDNQVRCITFAKDGSVLAGTNGGLAVIKNDKVVRTVGAKEGVKNTVFLTVAELDDGRVLAGSDGDGLYFIDGTNVTNLGRDDGLTSDVIMRIIPDSDRGVYWLVTSNSIEYIKDGRIKPVTTFPYNNNYDIYFDNKGNAWILSSYGIYTLSADAMVADDITDYRIYTIENGLPYAVTSNSYSAEDDEGNLFVAGRYGVIRVNIDDFYEENEVIRTAVKSITCDNEPVLPDPDGIYRIPASDGRIVISAAVMDYSMLNPDVHMFLEGTKDDGITATKSALTSLEYTGLAYGDYTLHVQILDRASGAVLQDDTFRVAKTATLMELLIVRILLLVLLAIAAGFIVWGVMRSTIIRRQYDEIRLAKEEADRANSAKTRFLANMSHEIRTPINTIMGMNEMVLREDASGVPKSYFLSMMNYALDIRKASESLLGLINDLLDISKIESGKMHLVEQEYDVQDMLRSIVSMIRVRSEEKGLAFDVTVDEIIPKRLYGDMGKIKQIVLNLLTNAVKYTEEGGFVLNVSMDSCEDDIATLRFSVKDTGIGVKAEDMEKLFTAYERLDEEKNSAIQGTGLGLDISRRFAELMGGRLWCESVYGEGSEFILVLAQRIVDRTALGIFTEKDGSEVKGPYIPKFIAPDADILVVDDDPMNLNVIKGLLKATKVFVVTATSGEEAIDKIKDTNFHVVLLDHMMPGMDGVETVGKIREFAPDLPVYALTANATAGEEFYKSKGFNGYLSKPIESEVLEMTLMKHLPEEMVKKPEAPPRMEELTEIPESLKWIYETEGITVEEGIRNSGGISNYIFSLELFLDTIDGNAKVLKEAYETQNIRLYTIKVHALKSSARIIGATELSSLAASLEDAGNRQDTDFIKAHADQLMEQYLSYKDRLCGIKGDADDDARQPISEEDLQDAYAALRDVVPQMDYDAVEMILINLKEYKLPKEDAEKIEKLSIMLKSFDWDGIEKLFS